MFRLLAAIGALLSLFTFITTGADPGSSSRTTQSGRWAAIVKTHHQFGNWT
jgi:hypothetical protein